MIAKQQQPGAAEIVVIAGHPDPESYCGALARAYIQGAEAGGASVRLIDLSAVSFEPVLRFGYRQRTDLEPALIEAQQLIRQARQLVFVYPTWWGAMPAVLKGFLDRILLPGFAYRYRSNSPLWDKLLTGKHARLIVTTDTPTWFNRLIYWEAGHNVMKRNILHFCGIKPVRITEVGPIRSSTPQQRELWLERVRRLGLKRA